MITPVDHVWHPGPMAAWHSGMGITVNTRFDQQRDQVLLHEAGHVGKLGHCKKNSCLMYYKTSYFFDKNLCEGCEIELSSTI